MKFFGRWKNYAAFCCFCQFSRCHLATTKAAFLAHFVSIKSCFSRISLHKRNFLTTSRENEKGASLFFIFSLKKMKLLQRNAKKASSKSPFPFDSLTHSVTVKNDEKLRIRGAKRRKAFCSFFFSAQKSVLLLLLLFLCAFFSHLFAFEGEQRSVCQGRSQLNGHGDKKNQR